MFGLCGLINLISAITFFILNGKKIPKMFLSETDFKAM